MAPLIKSIVFALCVFSGVEGLNKALRIGSGGRTIQDFRKEVCS